MGPRLISTVVVIVGLLQVSAQAEESQLLALRNNPFTRPEVLKAKPPPPPQAQQQTVVAPEKITLEITATLVSSIMPMAIVNGELLGVGDSIEGFKLIAVMEGKAIFARGGKQFSHEVNPEESE